MFGDDVLVAVPIVVAKAPCCRRRLCLILWGISKLQIWEVFFFYLWLQIDLGSLHLVCAVATQGNPGGNRDYVRRYKLQCSTDGVNWTVYEENGNSVTHMQISLAFRVSLFTAEDTKGALGTRSSVNDEDPKNFGLEKQFVNL